MHETLSSLRATIGWRGARNFSQKYGVQIAQNRLPRTMLAMISFPVIYKDSYGWNTITAPCDHPMARSDKIYKIKVGNDTSQKKYFIPCRRHWSSLRTDWEAFLISPKSQFLNFINFPLLRPTEYDLETDCYFFWGVLHPLIYDPACRKVERWIRTVLHSERGTRFGVHSYRADSYQCAPATKVAVGHCVNVYY